MGFDNILKALFPLKKLIYYNRLIKSITLALLMGGGFCVMLSLSAFVFPIVVGYQLICKVILMFLLIGVITSIFYIPKNIEIIKIADSLGLKEQVLTSYEFKENLSPVCLSLRDKTYKAILNLNFKKNYPLKINTKVLLISLGLFLAAVTISFIPNEYKSKTIEFNNLKNELIAKVSEISKEKILKDDFLTKEDKVQLIKELQSLTKELNSAKEIQDLQKSAKRFENSLRSQSESAQNLKADLDWLSEKLKNANAGERKELADKFQKLSKDLENNKELYEALKELSKKLNSDSTDVAESVKKVSEELAKLANSDEQLKKSINKYKKSLANNMGQALAKNSQNRKSSASKAGTGENTENSSQEASNEQNDNSNSEDSNKSGDKEGSKQGNKTAQNGNNQPDQRAKDGSGKDGSGKGSDGKGKGADGKGKGADGKSKGTEAGGGVGTGSSNSDLGITSPKAGNAGRNPGEAKIKDFESIYSSKFLGGDSTSSTVKGQKSNSGSSIFSEASGEIQKGEEISYDKIYSEYREEAMKNLDSSQLPPQYKDKVRNYFTEIDEVSK